MSQKNIEYRVYFLERADHAKPKLMYSAEDLKTASSVAAHLQVGDPMSTYFIKEVTTE